MNAPRNPLAPLAIAGAAACWAAFLYALVALPARIPLSWNDDGGVAAYGSKFTLAMLPICTIVAAAIMARARRGGAQSMHLPFDVAEDRLDAVWAVSLRYLNVVEVVLTMGFAAIEAAIVLAVTTDRPASIAFAVFAFIAALVLSIVAMLISMRKAAR